MNEESIEAELKYLNDTLYVLSGKWKLPILLSVAHGNLRFKDIKKYLPGITSRTLARELRELELHKLIFKNAADGVLTHNQYQIENYCKTLQPLLTEMVSWGKLHRQYVKL